MKSTRQAKKRLKSLTTKKECSKCKKIFDLDEITLHHIFPRRWAKKIQAAYTSFQHSNYQTLVPLCYACHAEIEELNSKIDREYNMNLRVKTIIDNYSMHSNSTKINKSCKKISDIFINSFNTHTGNTITLSGGQMKKKLFIFVDMQNDFMDEDGALYVPGSSDIKENIRSLVKKANRYATHVVYTKDDHVIEDIELSDNPDFKSTFPMHCMRNTVGSELIPESICGLMPNGKIFRIFTKNQFSIFAGSEKFVEFMSGYFDEIYVAGVSGDVCVKYAIDGLISNKGSNFHFNKLFIINDCIASLKQMAFDNYITELSLQYEFVKVIPHTAIGDENDVVRFTEHC